MAGLWHCCWPVLHSHFLLYFCLKSLVIFLGSRTGIVEHFLANSAEEFWAHHQTPSPWDLWGLLVTIKARPCHSPRLLSLLISGIFWVVPSGSRVGKETWWCVHCLSHTWHMQDSPGEVGEHWAACSPPFCFSPCPLGSCQFPARGRGGDVP